MRKILSLAMLLTAMSTAAQQPQTEPQQIAPLPLDTAVRYGVLDNGLTYYETVAKHLSNCIQ